jgi:hypothetical protein
MAFFIQGLIAFVGFALPTRLLNYRALQDKPMSWRIAGSIGVAIWTVNNFYVHSRSRALGRMDMDAVSIIAVLPGPDGPARVLFPPAT